MNPVPFVTDKMSHPQYLSEDVFVSSSQLKRHLPEYFRPFNGSPSADIGSVLHARFTGDQTPVTVVDAATWTGKAAKETRETVVASGGYAILSGDQVSIDGMFEALSAHSVARSLLIDEPGRWELSVFAEVDGVPSKCRFDRLLDTVGVDVKTTTAKPGPHSLMRAVIDWGYDVQAAHYMAVAAAAGIDLDAFVFVFVSKDEPHHVTVAYLDEAFMERGRTLRDLALQRFLHPEFTPAYPGQTEPVTLTLPRWAEL